LTSWPAEWKISDWTAPGGNAQHAGVFKSSHVVRNFHGLGLKLVQRKRIGGGFISEGAEVTFARELGYGTYTWVARATFPAVSGSVMGLFNYRTGSETEIDIEVEGGERRNLLQFTTWKGENLPNEHRVYAPPILPSDEFYALAYRWLPDRCEFYVNGSHADTHIEVVPSRTACPMMNHWGTHNANWGGLATPDVERWVWVKSFRFTPL
jgi:beta-glucanase (GH16 family)